MVLVRSQDGSVGISAYREKLSLVSEKMISCTESKNFLVVFKGSDKDPLLSAWRESEKLINSLPEYLQPAMISVFRKPVEIAAETVLNSILKRSMRTGREEYIISMIKSYPVNIFLLIKRGCIDRCCNGISTT
jgi:hypothetical protein